MVEEGAHYNVINNQLCCDPTSLHIPFPLPGRLFFLNVVIQANFSDPPQTTPNSLWHPQAQSLCTSPWLSWCLLYCLAAMSVTVMQMKSMSSRCCHQPTDEVKLALKGYFFIYFMKLWDLSAFNRCPQAGCSRALNSESKQLLASSQEPKVPASCCFTHLLSWPTPGWMSSLRWESLLPSGSPVTPLDPTEEHLGNQGLWAQSKQKCSWWGEKVIKQLKPLAALFHFTLHSHRRCHHLPNAHLALDLRQKQGSPATTNFHKPHIQTNCDFKVQSPATQNCQKEGDIPFIASGKRSTALKVWSQNF